MNAIGTSTPNASVTKGTSLEIFRVRNGWVVRDSQAFRCDPLNEKLPLGTWVYPNLAELAKALPKLLEEVPSK